MAQRKRKPFSQIVSENSALRRRRPRLEHSLSEKEMRELAPKPSSVALNRYSDVLETYARRVEALVEKRLVPALAQGPAAVRAALAGLEVDFELMAGRLRGPALTAGKRASDHARRAVARLFGAELSRSLLDEAIVNEFGRRNVALLRKLGADQIRKLREAVGEYEDASQAAEHVREVLWVSRNRSRLIATDQIHKLHHEVESVWATALGSDAYIYVTRQDERVRESHRPHHGKVFRWRGPHPDTGPPGTQPGCRCIAVPLEVDKGARRGV